LKIIKILKNFWHRLKRFIRHDFITILLWAGKFVIGGLIIIGWDLKQFFERKKGKEV